MSNIQSVLNGIPMKRWLLASRRLQLPTADLDDQVPALMMVANEILGRDSGTFDNYVALSEMGIEEIAAIVNVEDKKTTEDEAEADEADKSRA